MLVHDVVPGEARMPQRDGDVPRQHDRGQDTASPSPGRSRQMPRQPCSRSVHDADRHRRRATTRHERPSPGRRRRARRTSPTSHGARRRGAASSARRQQRSAATTDGDEHACRAAACAPRARSRASSRARRRRPARRARRRAARRAGTWRTTRQRPPRRRDTRRAHSVGPAEREHAAPRARTSSGGLFRKSVPSMSRRDAVAADEHLARDLGVASLVVEERRARRGGSTHSAPRERDGAASTPSAAAPPRRIRTPAPLLAAPPRTLLWRSHGKSQRAALRMPPVRSLRFVRIFSRGCDEWWRLQLARGARTRRRGCG